MKLYKTTAGVVIVREDEQFLLKDDNLDSIINDDNLLTRLAGAIEGQKAQTGLLDNGILPPVGRQEIWAAGVTYYRSKVGRQEESKAAYMRHNARSFFSKVLRTGR
jgi:2-dehydro-3-deoxy-D-arabinonate dehydratase